MGIQNCHDTGGQGISATFVSIVQEETRRLVANVHCLALTILIRNDFSARVARVQAFQQ